MDGWITIGAKIVDKLNDGLKKIKKKLDSFDEENEVKIEVSTDESKGKIEEIGQEIRSLVKDYNKLMSEDIISDSDLRYAETLRNEIGKAVQEYEKISGEKIHIKSLEEASNNAKKIDSSMSSILKKVAKWGLAIFGIRSVYSFIRNSISTISQYNEQLAADVEYIRYALASSLEPVIKRIISLVQTLLTYINYIANAWIGHPIFKSAKDFADMKKSSAGVAKNAKEINKQLSGFDEMNILSDSSSSSGGGGSVDIPSFDLTNWGTEIPGWIKWIADNKDLILAALTGIAGAITAMKLSDLAKSLGLVKDGLKGIQALGIGVIVAGIVLLIQDIIDFMNDPSWENFAAILGDIAIIIGGIMLVMGNWWGLLVIFVGAIVKLVAENWDTIKEILGKIGGWIGENVVGIIVNLIWGLADTIASIIKTLISILAGIFSTIVGIITAPFKIAFETVMSVFDNMFNAAYNIVSAIGKLFSGDLKGALNDFKQAFSNVFSALWSIAKAPLNLIIEGINALIKGANKISFDVPDWVPGLGGKKFGFKIPTIPKLAKGGIINMPGRGVPIGTQAIGGEAGREGVIPLTDNQQMELLGEAIGKYININLTNVTKLDSRQIAREQKTINAQSDFAFNR